MVINGNYNTSAYNAVNTGKETCNCKEVVEGEADCIFTKNGQQFFEMDDLQNSIYQSFMNINISSALTLNYRDKTNSIDDLTDISKKYKQYIESNYLGEQKDQYLQMLGSYIQQTKTALSEGISTSISHILSLGKNDTDDLRNSIDSIIESRINGTELSETGSASFRNMSYTSLKTLSVALQSIGNDMAPDMDNGYADVNGVTAHVGLAYLKAKYITERTNLPSRVKRKLTEYVEKSAENTIESTIRFQELYRKLQAVWDAEESGQHNVADTPDDQQWKVRIMNRFSEMIQIVHDYKLSNRENLMKAFVQITGEAKHNFEDDIHEMKGSNSKYRDNKINKLDSWKERLADSIADSWNNFIKSIPQPDSDFYLPTNSHNPIDVLL